MKLHNPERENNDGRLWFFNSFEKWFVDIFPFVNLQVVPEGADSPVMQSIPNISCKITTCIRASKAEEHIVFVSIIRDGGRGWWCSHEKRGNDFLNKRRVERLICIEYELWMMWWKCWVGNRYKGLEIPYFTSHELRK